MKRKYLSIPLFVLMLSTVLSIPLHVMPASALPLAGPSLVVDDSINRINATLGINSGSQITAKGTIKNIGAVTLTNLLTGVFFIEGTGVLVPADFSFEYSPDGITWFPIHPSEVKVPTPAAAPMQVELVVGSPGGETLAPNATLTMHLRMTLNNNMSPIGWPTNIIQSMTVWVYGDTNLNRQYNGGEIIYSQPPAYGGLVGWDNPVKIDLAIVHTAEIAGTGKFYYSIQSAINAASPGDTIYVYPGTYDEAVIIGKSLTLQSESKWGAIIKPSTIASNAIYISADGVTVDGFEIDGTTVCKNGILGWETNGLIIKNNKIHGAVNAWDGCGILLFSWGNSGTVYNNYIADNEVYDTGRMGIMVMDYGPDIYTVTSDNTITGNTVHDVWKVAWGDGGGGIQINVGKNCAITNNLVYNVQNGQRGIYMFGSAAGNTITCNTVRDNPIGIQLWISGEQPTPYINWGVETPTSPQVHYNSIYHNSLYGAKSTNIQGTPMVMDARYNWWGQASGPFHPVTNTGGLGNNVTDNVDYSPWLGKTVGSTPMTWHVNPTGTIQEAIDEAQSGNTIIVHSGTYNEALYVNKSLTIKAASTPIITGGQLFATSYGNRQAVIFVKNAINVILNGFDIEGQGLGIPGGTKSYAVLYENSKGAIQNCTVSPNTIGDMYSTAVAAWDNSVVTITGCTIKNFGRIGVYSNNATMSIVGNTIIGQVYAADNLVNYGIEIEDYSGPSIATITQNVIYNCNNTHPNPSWSSAAIIVDVWREWADVSGLTLLPSKVSITYNTIYDNYESIEIVSNEFSYAHYNNFTNNAWGVWSAPENWTTNPTYHVFDARFNWWGDASGPHHTTSWMYNGNPYGPHFGSGDEVSDYVLYDPWTGLPLPTISVRPPLIEKQMVNTTFAVNITISNLSGGYRAVGFQFRLCYDSELIEAINVTEGPFLKDPMWNPEGTFFISSIEVDPIYGPCVLVGILVLPNDTGSWEVFPVGNGTLATITFRTLMQETGLEKLPLTCDLTLVSTQIINDDLEEIQHNTNNGLFKMYPTNAADINRDYKVDMKDVGIAARAFGTFPGHERWNPLADITGPITWVPDGKIDMRDIGVIARNFGWRPLDDP